MKKKIVKTALCLALAGTLAFSSVGASFTGMETVEAAKVVQQTTLGQVTGIKFDAEKQEITWNKVSHATKYEVTVKNAAGKAVTRTAYRPSIDWSEFTGGYWDEDDNYYSFGEDGTYTVSIVAIDTSGYYVAAQGEYIEGYWEKFDT